MNNIICLIGNMCSGKSSVGALLANKLRLHMPYIDLDEYICSTHKMTIPEIFNFFGEGGFRELERQALINILDQNDHQLILDNNQLILDDRQLILATGGGTVIDPNNLQVLHEYKKFKCKCNKFKCECNNFIRFVYLQVSPNIQLERLINNPGEIYKRPTLQQKTHPLEKIHQLEQTHLLEFLQDLHTQRHQKYLDLADIIIDGNQSLDTVVNEILSILSK